MAWSFCRALRSGQQKMMANQNPKHGESKDNRQLRQEQKQEEEASAKAAARKEKSAAARRKKKEEKERLQRAGASDQ